MTTSHGELQSGGLHRSELHLELLSDPGLLAGARHQVESFATAQGFGDVAVGDVGLCVNEAMANVIRHAYAGKTDRPIVLDAAMEAGELVIKIRDWGNGRVPDMRRPPPEPSADVSTLHPGGLGLPCLKLLLDGIEFIPQPDGMLLKMIRRRR